MLWGMDGQPHVLLLLLCLAAEPVASEIVDLGVFSENSVLNLEGCKRRKDFSRFQIEFLPQNARGMTNKVTITTTNDVLKLGDLATVPQGVAIMGVRSYCEDGAVSELALYRIDVQRAGPSKPRVMLRRALKPVSEQQIEHVIERLEAPTEFPPMPPMPPIPGTNAAIVRTALLPLPGGTNDSYARYQHRLEQAALLGRRRSQ